MLPGWQWTQGFLPHAERGGADILRYCNRQGPWQYLQYTFLPSDFTPFLCLFVFHFFFIYRMKKNIWTSSVLLGTLILQQTTYRIGTFTLYAGSRKVSLERLGILWYYIDGNRTGLFYVPEATFRTFHISKWFWTNGCTGEGGLPPPPIPIPILYLHSCSKTHMYIKLVQNTANRIHRLMYIKLPM